MKISKKQEDFLEILTFIVIGVMFSLLFLPIFSIEAATSEHCTSVGRYFMVLFSQFVAIFTSLVLGALAMLCSHGIITALNERDNEN